MILLLNMYGLLKLSSSWSCASTLHSLCPCMHSVTLICSQLIARATFFLAIDCWNNLTIQPLLKKYYKVQNELETMSAQYSRELWSPDDNVQRLKAPQCNAKLEKHRSFISAWDKRRNPFRTHECMRSPHMSMGRIFSTCSPVYEWQNNSKETESASHSAKIWIEIILKTTNFLFM